MSPSPPLPPQPETGPPFACTGCGYRVEADRPFCRHCGQRLTGAGRRLALDLPDWPPRLAAQDREHRRLPRPDELPSRLTIPQGIALLLIALACFPVGLLGGCALLRRQRPAGARGWGAAMLALGLLVPLSFWVGLKVTGSSIRTVTQLAELVPWLAPDPTQCCQVDEVRVEQDEKGRDVLRGIVRNRTPRPILRLHLVLRLLDQQGRTLQECLIPVAGPQVENVKLPPFEAASFSFVLPQEIEWKGDYTVSFEGLKLGWP